MAEIEVRAGFELGCMLGRLGSRKGAVGGGVVVEGGGERGDGECQGGSADLLGMVGATLCARHGRRWPR